jgi:pimeloyl-ACP methyl ester carboxylesterase
MSPEKQLKTDELTINYVEGPKSGPPLVMLHGLTGAWQGWSSVLPELQKNWHVFAPDLRGHGKTGRSPDMQFRNQDYARDVIALLKTIGEPVVLAGHSLGAMVSIVVAAEYPEGVNGVVLVDPPLYSAIDGIDAQQDALAWFKGLLSMLEDEPSFEQVLAKMRAVMPEMDENSLQAQSLILSHVAAGTLRTAIEDRIWEGVDLRSALSRIKCPIHMIYGDWSHGAVIRDEDVALVKEVCPSAVLVHIPNASHMIPLERPDIVMQQINALLPVSDR